MKLCIVIPAYNEEKLLGRAIRSAVYAGVHPSDIYILDEVRDLRTARAVAKNFQQVTARNQW